MRLGSIILWIFVFVVGSLIVTAIVSPNGLKSVGDTINNIVRPAIANVTKQNYVMLIPSKMQEYNPYNGDYINNIFACSFLEASGQANGISDAKAILCEEACGKRSMNYGYYTCDKDLLTCFCSP